jgi:hypothetical protein
VLLLLSAVVIVVVVIVKQKSKKKKSTDTVIVAAETEMTMTTQSKMKKTMSRRFSVANVATTNWQLVMDPDSGDQYWLNNATNHTQWEQPAEIAQAIDESKLGKRVR